MKYLKRFENVVDIVDFYNTDYYTSKRNKYGKLGWRSKDGQLERFDALLNIGVKGNDSILDYGCGYGDLLEYLWSVNKYKNVDYYGVDINSEFINKSKEEYGDEFFGLIKSYKNVNDSFDWFLASGVFTVFTSNEDLYNTIDHFYKKVNKGLSFNLMYGYCEKDDYCKKEEYRGYDPKIIEKYFKTKYNKVEVSSLWTTNTDPNYTPPIDGEFNVYIYK